MFFSVWNFTGVTMFMLNRDKPDEHHDFPVQCCSQSHDMNIDRELMSVWNLLCIDCLVSNGL